MLTRESLGTAATGGENVAVDSFSENGPTDREVRRKVLEFHASAGDPVSNLENSSSPTSVCATRTLQ
jgi:hypothetical protein